MVVIVVVTDSATLTGTSTGNTLQLSDDRGCCKVVGVSATPIDVAYQRPYYP